MTTNEILERLDRQKKQIEKIEAFVLAHREQLNALNLDMVSYGSQIDFDTLSHPEIIRVIQAFPGTWVKKPSNESSGTRIDYETEFDGMKLRCWAGEPPPSCKIVEETVEVPAQPASTRTVRKLVCANTERIQSHYEKITAID